MASAPSPTNKAATDDDLRKQLSIPGSVDADVSTDPRVFEWISTGLYREPASAIRELISNAYDADATNVIVTTDAPFFRSITVEDDGTGMSVEALTRLVHHVGGSWKRDERGRGAGITGARPGYSVNDRRLIGSKGIGIYSVSRLTPEFRITTKEENSTLEHIATIRLSKIDEDAQSTEPFVAGRARIVTNTVNGKRVAQRGTKIELLSINDEARRVLQSIDQWRTFDSAYTESTPQARVNILQYHIARMSEKDPGKQIQKARLPWSDSDGPLIRFTKFVDALCAPDQAKSQQPTIDVALDYYLALIWKVALSAPLRYVEKAPGELTSKDGVEFYSLEGDQTPDPVTLRPGETIGERFGLRDNSSPTPFVVTIDGMELRRPVVFRQFTPSTRKLLKRPKLFVGKLDSKTPTGERLSCSVYFYWSYDLVPRESNGVLVRINGSSGTLFDHQFLDFRTAEGARLKQVSSEVYVYEGLDQALNVDRESFDDTDLRFLDLQHFVHRSMTRIMSRIKADQRKASGERTEETMIEEARRTEEQAVMIWRERRKTEFAPPVVVTSKSQGVVRESPDSIYVTGVPSRRRGGIDKDPVFNAQLRSIVLVLDAYGLLDELTPKRRASLIGDIARVLDIED